MRELLFKTWKLFREHWILLWLPFVCADIVNFGHRQLNRVVAKMIVNWLATSHSVLGGSYLSPDLDAVQRKALIASTPISLAAQFLTAFGYVVAFWVIARLVDLIHQENGIDVTKILTEIALHWRAILLFSLKFCVAYGVLTWAVFWPLGLVLDSMPRLKETFSQFYIPVLATIVVGCVAWLLIPRAIAFENLD
jgi:hypothetical protein